MNTELSPEITRTSSKTHGKIANDNSSDFAENDIRLQCLESYQTTCYRKLSWQTKAWNDTTKCIDQKSLTDHEPKEHRKYDGTHVNIASDTTDSYMAGTTINRHVGELVHGMARQPTVIIHVYESKHDKTIVIGCMDH